MSLAHALHATAHCLQLTAPSLRGTRTGVADLSAAHLLLL